MIGTLTLDSRVRWPGTRSTSRQVSRQVVQDATALPLESETSFQLLLRARAGDEEAKERLCAYYLPRLHRWAQGRLPCNARGAVDTGDIVQDVLMHAFEHIEVFEPRHQWAFQAYLRRSIVNRIRDEARRAGRRPAPAPLDSSYPDAEPSPLQQAIGVEGLERYEAALQTLSPEDQQAIVARCEWGMSHAEVAELLGKPTAGAARVAVCRALVRLAKEMARGSGRS
jgi:RNA polymerase sigma factor (sigma-70 family)